MEVLEEEEICPETSDEQDKLVLLVE